MVRLVSSLFCLHLYFVDCPSLPYTISCNLNPISDLFMLLWLFDMHSRVRLVHVPIVLAPQVVTQATTTTVLPELVVELAAFKPPAHLPSPVSAVRTQAHACSVTPVIPQQWMAVAAVPAKHARVMGIVLTQDTRHFLLSVPMVFALPAIPTLVARRRVVRVVCP